MTPDWLEAYKNIIMRVICLFISASVLLQTLWTPVHLLRDHGHGDLALQYEHEHEYAHEHTHRHEDDADHPEQDKDQDHPASVHDLKTTLARRVLSLPVRNIDVPPVRVVCTPERLLPDLRAVQQEYRPPGEFETLVRHSRAPPSV